MSEMHQLLFEFFHEHLSSVDHFQDIFQRVLTFSQSYKIGGSSRTRTCELTQEVAFTAPWNCRYPILPLELSLTKFSNESTVFHYTEYIQCYS